MTKKLGQKLSLQLSLLEAKSGMAKPSISWCEDAVKSRNVSRRLTVHGDDPAVAINRLRLQKTEAKLYHVRHKLLPKEMKKVKALGVQRIVKKIKQMNSGTDEASRASLSKLEKELAQTKALDQHILAELAFTQKALKGNPYVKEKLELLGYKLPEAAVSLNSEVTEKITNSKSYAEAVKRIQSELEVFLRKLLHEQPNPVKVSQPKKHEPSKPSASESFFLTSLNDNAIKGANIDVDSDYAVQPGLAFSDDDEFESDEEENKHSPIQFRRSRARATP